MKKQLKYSLVIVLLFFMFINSNAQISVGGGVGYGTEIESIGITIKGNYPFTEDWEGSGSFTYFFPNSNTDFLKLTFWELNADAHYNVLFNEKYTFYALGGLSVAGVKFNYDDLPSNPFFTVGDVSNTEIGLNLGIGGELIFSESVSGYAEVKYTLSGFDQLIANVGVLFQLGAGGS